MADLMQDTYTYEDLKKKYGNFHMPFVKVKIDGTDIAAEEEAYIISMSIYLSLLAANTVEIKIANLYDRKRKSFDSGIRNKLQLGSVAEVELGYVKSSVCVFKGYVSSVGVEYDEEPLISVTLMDARRLMMQRGARQVAYDVPNYTDAISKIMKDYSKLCKLEMDATNDKLTRPIIQRQSDYHFITKELIQTGVIDREFFIVADKAYVRTPRKVKTPIMTLTPSMGLLTFAAQEEYQDLKVEVIGYDSQKQEILQASETVKPPSNQRKLLSETPVSSFSDSWTDTQEMVNARAKNLASALQWKRFRGRGTTIGLPELVPGRYLQIKEMDSSFADHKYYLTNVTHEINGKNFVTTFEIGGWI